MSPMVQNFFWTFVISPNSGKLGAAQSASFAAAKKSTAWRNMRIIVSSRTTLITTHDAKGRPWTTSASEGLPQPRTLKCSWNLAKTSWYETSFSGFLKLHLVVQLRHWIMKGLSPKSSASSFLKSLLAFGYDKVENQAKRSHGSNHQSNKKAWNQTVSNLYLLFDYSLTSQRRHLQYVTAVCPVSSKTPWLWPFRK